MNRTTLAAGTAAAFCALLIVAPLLAQLGPTKPHVARVGLAEYEGAVTNLSANGFTISRRRDGATVTVSSDDKTAYTVVTRRPVTSLQAGEAVAVIGVVNPAALTVVARSIIPAADAPKSLSRPNMAGRAVVGTIAGMSPLMTVASNGKTYSVETSPRTNVVSREPGSAGNLAVGKNVAIVYVTASASADGLSVTARRVVISDGPPSRVTTR